MFWLTRIFYDKYFVYQQLDFTAELYQRFYSSSGGRTGSASVIFSFREEAETNMYLFQENNTKTKWCYPVCIVHDRCVAICSIGRHYKKCMLSKSAPSGCAAMRSTPSFPDTGGKGTRCWNIILHGNLCSRAEMKNISIVCFFRTTDAYPNFPHPQKLYMIDVSIMCTWYFHIYINTVW